MAKMAYKSYTENMHENLPKMEYNQVSDHMKYTNIL